MTTTQNDAYRSAASAERLAASQATLPRVRERHIRAAEAWDVMAEQAELKARMTEANARGQVKYAYQRLKTNRSGSSIDP